MSARRFDLELTNLQGISNAEEVLNPLADRIRKSASEVMKLRDVDGFILGPCPGKFHDLAFTLMHDVCRVLLGIEETNEPCDSCPTEEDIKDKTRPSLNWDGVKSIKCGGVMICVRR